MSQMSSAPAHGKADVTEQESVAADSWFPEWAGDYWKWARRASADMLSSLADQLETEVADDACHCDLSTDTAVT